MIERVGVERPRFTSPVIHYPRGHCVLYPFAGDYIERCVAKTRDFYEAKALDLIKSLNIGGVYIDVGAHCGNHSVFFLTECKASAVIAIEAAPDLYELLRDNMERNGGTGRSFTVHAAAGDTGGFLTVGRPDARNTGGGTTCGPCVRVPTWSVPVVSLDNIYGNVSTGPVGYIKLDVEGAEFNAILGARGIISAYAPAVSAEVRFSRGAKEKITALLDRLTDDGVRGPRYQKPIPFPAHSESYLWLPK